MDGCWCGWMANNRCPVHHHLPMHTVTTYGQHLNDLYSYSVTPIPHHYHPHLTPSIYQHSLPLPINLPYAFNLLCIHYPPISTQYTSYHTHLPHTACHSSNTCRVQPIYQQSLPYIYNVPIIHPSIHSAYLSSNT